MNVLFFVSALALGMLANSAMFWLLLGKRMPFLSAIRVTCAAQALNKLLFTGSGYASMAWKLHKEGMPAHKALSAFVALEACSVLPWLALGLYFGAKISGRAPLFLVFLLLLILVFAAYKRKSAAGFLKNALRYLKELRYNLFLVAACSSLGVMCGVAYYLFFFKAFGVALSPAGALKIASIAFSVGYLSPSPGGLGFREGSVIFLLTQQHVTMQHSLYIAAMDRLVSSAVVCAAGFLCAAGILRGVLRKRETL